MTIASGTLISASDYDDIAIDSGGALILANDISIGGDLIVTGTLQTSGYTVTGASAVTGVLERRGSNLHIANTPLDFSGTSTGDGDVVGATRRSSLVANTLYSFGSPYTALSFDSGGVPTAFTVTLALTAPAGITNSILRTYDITGTGASAFSATI